VNVDDGLMMVAVLSNDHLVGGLWFIVVENG
jgi:hypothetical protein